MSEEKLQSGISILPHETHYKDFMENEVMPDLQAHERDLYIRNTEGEKLFVRIWETTQVPRGIVLISHGFTEQAEKYREFAWYITQAGYHAILPEHCGHGRSYRLCSDLSMVDIDRWQRYVTDLITVTKAAVSRYPDLAVTVFAHSMGGAIAVHAVRRRPDLFRQLILSSPMIAPATAGLPLWLAGTLAAGFCLIGKAQDYAPGNHAYQGLEDFESSAGASRARFDYDQAIKASDPHFQTSGASMRWLREAAKMCLKLNNAFAAGMKVPVTLFQAASDTVVLLPPQDRLISHIPGGKKIVIEDASIQSKAKHELFNTMDDLFIPYIRKVLEVIAQDV